jgi:sec-independent protein translocase protein TatC
METPPQKEMPFLDHLEELRWRLIRALGAFAVGFIIAFIAVLKLDVIKVLQKPIAPYLTEGGKLVYTHPGDPFSIVITAALILGTILALPVILYQLWAFLSPALYKHEKKVVIPVLIGAALLFAGGVSLAYFVVVPLTLSFLMTFQSASLTAMITASEYFGFVTTLALLFGVVFELPIVIVALAALGIVQTRMLSRFRKHAFVIIWATSAIITPGDFLGTTVVLTASLYLLYEVSIALAMVIERRRARRQAIADDRQEALA